jgi:hypothetical protein
MLCPLGLNVTMWLVSANTPTTSSSAGAYTIWDASILPRPPRCPLCTHPVAPLQRLATPTSSWEWTARVWIVGTLLTDRPCLVRFGRMGSVTEGPRCTPYH